MEDESKNIFVSSRGLMKICDYYSNTPISSIKNLYNYPDFNVFISNFINEDKCPIIYICSSAINDFLQKLLNIIPFKFILVTGDCDEDMPKDVFNNETSFNNFINNDKIIHWFCQNWVGNHEKITLMPIGMDYHTMQTKQIFWGPITSPINQELYLLHIRNDMKPFWERDIKCYSNFHFATATKHGYDRIEAIKLINKKLVYYEHEPLKRIFSWKKQTSFAFVISPHGGGFDCHRTWEALLLGCIVIVKTSKIDNIYDELPVLIVKSWDQVTETLLLNTVQEFKTKNFNYNKLNLDYWKTKIKSYQLK